jgi:hypothetical protein
LAILIVPILVTVIAVQQLSNVFFPRFLFGSMAFLLIIAVRGGFVLAHAVLPALSARQVTAIGLVLAIASATRVPDAWEPKQDYAAAVDFIGAQRTPGDAVACGPYIFLPLNAYLGLDCAAVNTTDDLDALEQAHERIWFLYTFPVLFEHAFPELWLRVKQDYSPVTRLRGSVADGDIVITLNTGQAPNNRRKEN